MADRQERRDRYIKEHIHDPYRMRSKPEGPLACPDCGAVYMEGRWRWPEHQRSDLPAHVCPACQRIADDCPAGIVTIEGEFTEAHREEIRGLILHEADDEAKEHPMDRVLGMSLHDGGMTITTTDIHLARRLGEALHAAFKGNLSQQYAEEGYLLRVRLVR